MNNARRSPRLPRVANWKEIAAGAEARYRDGDQRIGNLDDPDQRQRQLTRMGNAAGAVALAELMEGRASEAAAWFDRAAERYRESWADAPAGSWGRPIGAIKSRILAGDWDGAARDAEWALDEGAADAESPIGRYAAALALLVRERDANARAVAGTLRDRDDFPRAVADALATIAAGDRAGYLVAVEDVLESFEKRGAYLEDVAVADTVLVLQALAARRDVAVDLPPSPLLPQAATSGA
jgi:hypothetical protein